MADARSRPPETPRRPRRLLAWALASLLAAAATAQGPGERSLLDAHNAYPYHGRWSDRLDRALATGTPLAIEQDLSWATDPGTGAGRSVVAHEEPFDGAEPTLEDFFERIRPIVESALASGSKSDWPLITLNLDVKAAGDHAEHHAAILATLERHSEWLSTAPPSPEGDPTPIRWGPVLVLTGSSDEQERSFRENADPERPLLLFGAVHDAGNDEDGLPLPRPATDYRRWWNHPWRVVESEGQREAGALTAGEIARLRTLVGRARGAGLWIRLYTLNGAGDARSEAHGWHSGYDFGSAEAVRARWRACLEAGVDFVATDQYEELAALRSGR